jgi:hypothetical protein
VIRVGTTPFVSVSSTTHTSNLFSHRNVRVESAAFLDAVAQFRDDLVVGSGATLSESDG